MATSPADGMATLIRNLEEKTGKSIDAWVVIGRGSGKTKHKDLVAWLKSEVAIRTLAAADSPAAGSEDLVIAQYSGTKAGMRPVYDALVKHISKFGPDVEFSPKKAYVSLRRSKQFGLIQPTAARVDVGIVLKDVAPGERLEASGSFNAMVTHRVRISNVREVDSALIGWLRQAYDKA
jgi:predicted transport protein